MFTRGWVWSAFSFYDANHTHSWKSIEKRLSGASFVITLSCLRKCHCLVTGRGMVLLAIADKGCHQWAILPGRLKEGREIGWLLSVTLSTLSFHLTTWIGGQLCQQTIPALLLVYLHVHVSIDL